MISLFILILDQLIGLMKCMKICLSEFTYPCFRVILGRLGNPDQFWKWNGYCTRCKKPKQGLKALFCGNFLSSPGSYPPCRMVWCGACYKRDESDSFYVNTLLDEDGIPMYDDPSDERRFKTGVDLITPFQCDLCVFRVLYKRNPRRTAGDKENLAVIRRMNLDAIWSREPSTITKNIGYMNTLITTCESSGFEPQLPRLGPFPSDDVQGFAVAFSMLVQSTRPGRHAKSHLQFETIRKQRSTFSNLYGASCESAESGQIVAMGEATKSFITNCPTNSLWFTRWQLGCRT